MIGLIKPHLRGKARLPTFRAANRHKIRIHASALRVGDFWCVWYILIFFQIQIHIHVLLVTGVWSVLVIFLL